MDWVSKLKHYKNNIDDKSLLDEAIATCENYFETMNEDELMYHSRPLVISYLALRYEKLKKDTGK